MRKKLIMLGMVFLIGLFLAGCSSGNDVLDKTYEVTMIEVSGTAIINIPEDSGDSVIVSYTAKVIDGYGNEMTGEEVNWAIENVNGNDVNVNVYIDPEFGDVEVISAADPQQKSFKVVATSETNTDISGELIVSLESIKPGSLVNPVSLGTAGDYVILSPAGITNVPTSAITGDIGVSPIDSTAITGFSLTMDTSNKFATSSQITGKVYAADYAPPTPTILTTAVGDKNTAYNNAAGRASDYTELYAGDLSGKILAPGVYKWGTGVSINAGDVTLSGTVDDVWIFQISGQLKLADNTSINLKGGAQAQNIFWQVAETVSIGTDAQFKGIVLGWKDITVNTGASVDGRLFALTENVTLNQNIITAY